MPTIVAAFASGGRLRADPVDAIASEEVAATLTDFIASCQASDQKAEAAHHKQRKTISLNCRAVDTLLQRPLRQTPLGRR